MDSIWFSLYNYDFYYDLPLIELGEQKWHLKRMLIIQSCLSEIKLILHSMSAIFLADSITVKAENIESEE